jgi:hypothetical protein
MQSAGEPGDELRCGVVALHVRELVEQHRTLLGRRPAHRALRQNDPRAQEPEGDGHVGLRALEQLDPAAKAHPGRGFAGERQPLLVHRATGASRDASKLQVAGRDAKK